ncbi:CHAP domain-containing protein [Nonomuraea sp. H19]|uniref:CHAP domain-containing protein n=1 Tax=Nonomuraea sp. H19 TaxID=3452206 RepID=UPI003F8C13BD
MTPEMQKFIDLLESQLGYSEKAGAYTKFGDWYGKNVEFDADYSSAPWCEMYLSWAAHKLGYEEWIGQFAWTVAHAKWFKEQGAWGKTPKPGAFVYYDWSGSNNVDRIDHVGIVTRVEGGKIFTIEGNIDGGVAKRKERDTSKVVGYGYPERIKARLNEEAERQAQEAKKKAEEQAALPPGPGTDVGVLQMPQDSLTSMIPQSKRDEAARPTPAPAPGKKPQAVTGAPSPSETSAAAGQTAKKGKHAKPATADTLSATAEPLPTHADASATNPLPAVSTPTLVGSTLVAALALLAVAKTRQSRVRLAAATAGTISRPSKSNSHRRRRRKGRGAAEPVVTPLRTRPLLDAGEPAATSAQPFATADQPLGVVRADQRIAARHVEQSDAERHVAASGAEQVRRLLDTRPFDPFADAAPRRPAADRAPRRTAADRGPGRDATNSDHRTPDTSPFTPAFDTSRIDAPYGGGPFDAPLDTGPFEPCFDTGPMQRIRDTEPSQGALDTGPFEPCFDTGPMQRIRDTEPPQGVLDAGPFEPADSAAPLGSAAGTSSWAPGSGTSPLVVDTGPFQRIVIPGATSRFDAFAAAGPTVPGGDLLDSPPADTAAYRGRRRRREDPVEERFAAFRADLPPRGRRHRELVGAGSTIRAGRGRHRA